MSGRISRNKRTKSSKIICEERYSCDGENEEAVWECDECGTKQCEICDKKLHSIPKFEAHERRELPRPAKERLCQLKCADKNFADVKCNNCGLNFCHDCFDKMHAHGRRRQHEQVRLTFPRNPLPQTSKGQDEPKVVLQVSENISELKPPSPIEDDESLTYLSLPQDPNFEGDSQDDIAVLVDSISETGASEGQSQGASNLDPKGNIGNKYSDTVSDKHTDSLSSNPFSTGVVGLEQISSSSEMDYMQGLSLEDDNFDDRGEILDHDVNDEDIYNECNSFVLADQNEQIQVTNEDHFVAKLGCDADSLVKVVSIFGNTGDGKSHTLNHTFFSGKEIFKTSANQLSCTVGVWVAHDPVHNAIIIDTEGLLGVSSNQNQRTRLLLKVLAISDVIIYRTKADRLHNDMFKFLGDASKAYMKHFTQELIAASQRCKIDQPLSTLGPAVIIFHETQHTDILGKDSATEKAEMMLRRRFADLELMIDAFSALQYVGTRTQDPPTDFKRLLLAVKAQLRNTTVRSARKPSVVFSALQVLNEKFNGDIEKTIECTFPDQYFTCSSRCLSCSVRCCKTMNHLLDDEPHDVDQRCKYQHQYENKIFTCKACYDQGKFVTVVPKTAASADNTWVGLAKYAWAGYILECPNCGIIFRSRQFWYGNQDPERSVVRTEIKHVWPGGNTVLQGTHNAARRLLDSLNYATETVTNLSAKPAKAVSHWMADQIAPDYWIPNALIKECHDCQMSFTEKVQIHHCRACGQGFCDDCSTRRRPVPERGWGSDAVRVCDNCFSNHSTSDLMPDPSKLRARRVGEVITSTIGVVASAVDYPRDVLLESARPAYWRPDCDIKNCIVCEEVFNVKLSKHHCRSCGEGVCDLCSQKRRPVPSRGWDHPVRVCNTCHKKKDPL